MKHLVDVDALLEQGLITPDTAALLRQHALRDTGSTAINILLAFGAIAVAAGIGALTLSPAVTAILGAAFIALGWLARNQQQALWGKLGSIWMIVGALALAGSLGVLTDHPLLASLLAAAIFAGTAVVAGSNLLMALVPLALESAIGGSTGYWHACYEIVVSEPTLTIILFVVLAYAAWRASQRLTGLYQNLAIVFARMCVILVNFGFWVGSLWGDSPGKIWKTASDYSSFDFGANAQIPALVFVIGWALALLATGAWAAKEGRRFLVNTVATFGAIHLYTQWFERLGLEPISVMVAGVATIVIGLALWRYNRKVLGQT
jgi:hypothetical protein